MDLRQSIVNQTDVSLTLTRHIITTTAKDANLVLSPLSIHIVLTLIASGSKGPTQEQLLGFLKSKSNDEVNSLASQLVTTILSDGLALGGPRLAFANGIWADQSLTFKPEFEVVLKNNYKATSSFVDFQTKATEVAETVNTWAENETNGLIKELLPQGSVDASTRLIFTNALYFKGAWNEKFDPSQTKEHEFFLSDSSTLQVPFMTSKNKQYINAHDGFKVLGLPYKQGEDKRRFSMYIFLPDVRNGLPGLVEKMGSEPGFIDRHIPHQKVKVNNFLIPKFKIDFGFEASEVLKGLGLTLPFNDGGLTEMVDSNTGKSLYVSNIFHKSYIEVNEEGTEAASATAGVVMLRSLMVEEKLDFVADHPFLFVVREDVTGVVMFVGQVLNPLAN